MNSSATPLYAAIDLGTNTFHLLIASYEDGKLKTVHRERHQVKIAAGGIKRLDDRAVERAVAAAKSIGESLKKYPVISTIASGTAALRTASNGPELRDQIAELLGVPVQLIDGGREARLIARGVAHSLPDEKGNYLIMDIGGGSVEFIHMQNEEIKFAQSFPVGGQVLRTDYHTEEPFRGPIIDGVEQHEQLHDYLDQVLAPMLEAVPQGTRLVGASGTFDVLAKNFGTSISKSLKAIPAQRVVDLYAELEQMNLQTRRNDDRIPNHRADLIVVAVKLVEFVLSHYPQDEVLVSKYALKEGVIAELAELNPAH